MKITTLFLQAVNLIQAVILLLATMFTASSNYTADSNIAAITGPFLAAAQLFAASLADKFLLT